MNLHNDNKNTPILSLVIPTYNELGLGFLKQTLDQYSTYPGVEVICVDGGSHDGTVDLIQQSKAILVTKHNLNKFVEDEKKLSIYQNLDSRSARLNLGCLISKGQIVLFCHPRTFIDVECIKFLLLNFQNLYWGGFNLKFDKKHFILNFIAWYSNFVGLNHKGIVKLEQCIFVTRKFLNQLQMPIWDDVDFYEDLILSHKLSKIKKPEALKLFVETSAVKFKKNGVYKQAILILFLKLAFFLNIYKKKK